MSELNEAFLRTNFQRLKMPIISSEVHGNLKFFNQNRLTSYSHFSQEELGEQSVIKNQNTFSKKSPILTPGRKSASPYFFYANDKALSHHKNSGKLHNGLQHFFNENPISLKIPTTPTRSKSLSPSLRQIIQPPRIRHKQNDASNSYSKITNGNNSIPKQLDQFTNVLTSKKIKESEEDNLTLKADKFDNGVFFSTNSAFKACQKLPISSINQSSYDTKSISDLSSDFSLKSDLNCSIQSGQSLVSNLCFFNSMIPESMIKSSQEEKKQITTRLPFNVRTLNLKNFPADTSSSSKREFSLSHQKMLKHSQLKSFESNLQVLEHNVQLVVNKKLKTLIDECKEELIGPALRNVNASFKKESYCENEAINLLLNLLDKAKQQFNVNIDGVNTVENNDYSESDAANENLKRKYSDNENDESILIYRKRDQV